MASRPKLRELSAAIHRDGGDEYIFEQVIAGVPIRKIMEPYGVTRGMFYWWLRDGGEEREQAYEQAKKLSAEMHAEMEGLLLEQAAARGPGIAPQEVSLLKLRTDYHRYLARIRDREQFAEKTQGDVNVNVLNIGDAHLQQLRELGRMGQESDPAPIEADDAEYALLGSDDDE